MIIDNKIKDTSIDTSLYENEKILDIVMQRKMTTYLHRSLPMCIILSNENYKGWYYTNFVQIISNTFENGQVELNYLTPRDAYFDIAQVINMGYPILKYDKEISSYIIEMINKGYYLVIHIDEFYIPDKWAYEEVHFVHSSLIYGYNIEKRILYGIGFDDDMTFRKITFDFDAFNLAYEEGKNHYMPDAFWCDWSAVQLIKPKTADVSFKFDLNRFTNELNDYINSYHDEYKLYSFEFPMDSFKCGMEIYEYFDEKLNDLKDGIYNIDYRAIHLISEHKKGLLERFEYIKENYRVSSLYNERLIDYKDIVDRTNKIRLSFMVEFPLSTEFDTISQDKKDYIKNVSSDLKEIVGLERTILNDIYCELKKL